MLTARVELKEAVETYKTKTDSYLQRLEEAEIAKAKAVRAEAFGERHKYNHKSALAEGLCQPAVH